MIIVRTMNAGMCNQLFTYAFARYLKEQKKQEIVLDYSHTNAQEMQHNAMYEDALGHLGVNCMDVIKDIASYQKYTGKLGKKMENVLQPRLVRRRYRNQYILKQEMKNGEKLWKKGIGLNLSAEQCPEYFNKPQAEDTILFGYWQTPFYARQIQSILQDEILSGNVWSTQIKEKYEALANMEAVCVHVRRGDYVGNGMHEVCTLQYYKNAMEQFRQKLSQPHFYIFSDDKEYAKEFFLDGNEDITVVQERYADYEELVLMSACKHFIISNSSFSWWAQFLSGSKDVIAPNQWYHDAKKKSLLYEEHWKLLPVT